MTETILNSLYYQILFLTENEETIIRNIRTSSKSIIFIDAISYTLLHTQFFQINSSRMEKLKRILEYLLNNPEFFVSLLEKRDNTITNLITFCTKEIEKIKHSNREDLEFSYATEEAKKRNLLYTEFILPSAEEAAQYVLKEYPIIELLIQHHKLPSEKTNLKNRLSAMSLLVTTYKEVLWENKGLYRFILKYLQQLANTPLKVIGNRKRLNAILTEYVAFEFPDKEEKLTFTN